MMEECDTLLMVGSSFPYARVPARRRGRRAACRSTSTARHAGIRYPMEVNLTGDARETLRALLPLLERKTDRAWREQHRGATSAEWWQLLERARA